MLKRLLEWFWCPGPCKWETIQVDDIVTRTADEIPVGTRYTLRCKTCGEIKFRKG